MLAAPLYMDFGFHSRDDPGRFFRELHPVVTVRENRNTFDITRNRRGNLRHIASRARGPDAQAGFFKNAKAVLNPFCDRKAETVIDRRQDDWQPGSRPEHYLDGIYRRFLSVTR
jgi:hypothetical protein